MGPEILKEGTFFGAVRRSRQLGGVTLAETAYSPRCSLPRHAHASPYLCLVLSGSYTEQADGSMELACRPGSLVFHPAGAPHADRFDTVESRCFNIELGEAWTRRVLDLPVPIDRPVHVSPGPTSVLASRIYGEFRRSDDFSHVVVDGLVLAVMGELGRSRRESNSTSRPPWVDRCLELLHAQSTERLSLDQIAGEVGVHVAHLARYFMKLQGCTIGEYVRRLRVEKAQRELETTDASLAEVALAAGFADQSHFTRTFKALVGTTPGRYRRAVRGT